MNNFIIALVLLTTHLWAQNCRFGVLPRRDWHSLSDKERQVFFDGVKRTQVRSNNGYSFYDILAAVHWDYGNRGIHGYAQFLPWHRVFVSTLEREIQRQTNSNITIPYWNWSRGASTPLTAPIWGTNSSTLGLAAIGNNCVTSGAFANYRVIYPRQDCLRRNWNGNTLYNYGMILAIIDEEVSYDSFRRRIETLPHNLVHSSVGGQMGDFSSPNDPLFYLHHAFVDWIWYRFQINFNTLQRYDGNYLQRDGTVRPADLGDTLYYFNNVRVSDTLNVTNLCYYYASPVTVSASKSIIPKEELAGLVRKLEMKSDRPSNLFDVLIPDPIPDNWLERNHLNRADIKEMERKVKESVLKINQNSVKSLPTDALWEDDETLLQVLQAKRGSNFTVTVGAHNFDISITKEPRLSDFRQEVYDKLRELAKEFE